MNQMTQDAPNNPAQTVDHAKSFLKKGRILFVSDSVDFGGHEQVCLDLANQALAFADCEFAVSRNNQYFAKAIIEQIGVKPTLVNVNYRRLGVAFGQFYFDQRTKWRNVFATHPDHTIIVAQGRIEAATPVMSELASQRRPFHSLIPFAHSIEDLKGPGFYRNLEEKIRKRWYRLPETYIVPGSTAEHQLRARGVDVPIYKVPNLAATPNSKSSTSNTIRCIGRIDFWQKRQDLLVRLMAEARAHAPRLKIDFIGTGPDEDRLRKLIARLDLNDRCRVFGFLPRHEIYADCAAVIIPSRFEGVPLVMLEALSANIPVLGSNIDVFHEYLPRFALCDFIDAHSLIDSFAHATALENQPVWKEVYDRVRTAHGAQAHKDAAAKAISAVLNGQDR